MINSLESGVNPPFTCHKRCTINGESLRCADFKPHTELGAHWGYGSDGRVFAWHSNHVTKPREATEIIEFARRAIVAAGRRCADADEIELAALINLADTHREAVQTAVDGMRTRGMSWSYIASATGTSREAAYQKWGKK